MNEKRKSRKVLKLPSPARGLEQITEEDHTRLRIEDLEAVKRSGRAIQLLQAK
uniref:Uncharacterized protein n=1 Tax=Pseudomonas syringae pv. actinidiae TaxID=103796 RepID=M1JLR1_PSESF|nr:hypothetical protein [Pseudomonas syringae pv. actinidiae]ARO45418.1 hypothetical protein [Pseudomonas syringae pv. actinidiae]